jgi:hypothetical protein
VELYKPLREETIVFRKKISREGPILLQKACTKGRYLQKENKAALLAIFLTGTRFLSEISA